MSFSRNESYQKLLLSLGRQISFMSYILSSADMKGFCSPVWWSRQSKSDSGCIITKMNLFKNCSCHFEDKFRLWTLFCPLLIWKVSDVRFDCFDNRNRTQANIVSKWIALLILYKSLFINHNYISVVISAEQHAEQHIILYTCTKICNKICNKIWLNAQ